MDAAQWSLAIGGLGLLVSAIAMVISLGANAKANRTEQTTRTRLASTRLLPVLQRLEQKGQELLDASDREGRSDALTDWRRESMRAQALLKGSTRQSASDLHQELVVVNGMIADASWAIESQSSWRFAAPEFESAMSNVIDAAVRMLTMLENEVEE